METVLALCKTDEALPTDFYPTEEDGYDPVYEAQLAAHDACDALMLSMSEQLDALEMGTMTEAQRHTLTRKTDDLFNTVKQKNEEVPKLEASLRSTQQEADLQKAESQASLDGKQAEDEKAEVAGLTSTKEMDS